MRFLKKLLISVYVFAGAFAVASLIIFALTGNEPTALITCCFGVTGIESLLGVMIKTSENNVKSKSDKDEEV